MLAALAAVLMRMQALACYAQAQRDGSQQALQARIGNARLLGELAKFRLISLGSFFTMLKVHAGLCLHLFAAALPHQLQITKIMH